MSQFTPGRWSYFRTNPHYGPTVIGGDNRPICELNLHRPLEEVDKNGDLIAASPDLYEACQSLPLDMLDREDSIDAAEFVDHAHDFMQAMKKARAALVKAEGRTL